MINNNEKAVYSFKKDSLILRDLLAADRTILANERTLLAYIRTSLNLIVAGSSFIKFFDQIIIHTMGYLFIPFGICIGIWGLFRFFKISNSLKNIKTDSNYALD
jgi:putative membrane protein